MKKWSTAIIISLIVNFILFTGGAIYMTVIKPYMEAQPEPIVVELVDETVAEVPETLPDVTTPHPKKVDIPEPPSAAQMSEIDNGVAAVKVNDTSKGKDGDANKSLNEQNQTKSGPKNTKGDETGDPQPKQHVVTGVVYIGGITTRLPDSLAAEASNGDVVADIRVAADGSVASVSLENSTGSGAVDAWIKNMILSNAQFEPATMDGEAVAGEATLPLSFDITTEKR